MLEFVGAINTTLKEEDDRNKPWSLLLMKECGGTGCLSQIWEKLTESGKVKMRKRRRDASSEEDKGKEMHKSLNAPEGKRNKV